METTTASENNKRIAKNTLYLYFRSILTLGVGLYTSREVLAQLGISDYGIYNVVGGIIVLFSFIQTAMGNATMRFFTFDLGLGDFEKLKKTFSLSIVIHIFTVFVILILGETIGLWLLNTQLVIPAERVGAANFVYQFSVISACIGIWQIPYIAAITAHERMKIFAYAGLADAGFKLAVAIALGFAPIDKLKFYSILLFAIYIVMAAFYQIYCHKNFKETHFKWFWDNKMFLERLGFSGWTTLSGIAHVASLQGVNMIVNLFYGVLANAAIGVMTTVLNAAGQFSTNIAMAFNPQITKACAKDDFGTLHELMFRSCKFLFLLCFMIAIPLVINMDIILHLWLKEVPLYAVILCQIRLLEWCICMVQHPYSTAIYASGDIKRFIVVDSILVIAIFFIVWFLFSIEISIIAVPCAHLVINCIRSMNMFFMARDLVNISIRKLLTRVILPLFAVVIISIPLPIFLSSHFNGVLQFVASTVGFFGILLPITYFLALDPAEKRFLRGTVAKYSKLFRYSHS
jgi:O-antigen/teichoic acid export membrane protein